MFQSSVSPIPLMLWVRDDINSGMLSSQSILQSPLWPLNQWSSGLALEPLWLSSHHPFTLSGSLCWPNSWPPQQHKVKGAGRLSTGIAKINTYWNFFIRVEFPCLQFTKETRQMVVINVLQNVNSIMGALQPGLPSPAGIQNIDYWIW